LYDHLVRDILGRHRQMVFATGPRQVGKTTTCRALGTTYLSWDNEDDRRVILKGPRSLADATDVSRLAARAPVLVLDELHKFSKWRGLLKGFFDTYGDRIHVVVTGSSRMDVFRRGGDSLMGRYFLCRMHPFTIAEVISDAPSADLTRPPRAIADPELQALWEHGGYPEPFITRERAFSTRWQSLRRQQLLREDVRDLTQIHELAQLEVLGTLLMESSGKALVYSSLATEVRVSVDTVRRWIDALTGLHLGFRVRPWFKNVAKSLRKEPKWYLRDWAGSEDPGARAETFVACHLLKAVEGWTDRGLGRFELRYLRDKAQREVDFVVIRDNRPWCLVEVKKSETQLSPALAHFQAQLKAPHAFQVVLDLDYVDADCFSRHDPVVVPARTFLSQLT